MNIGPVRQRNWDWRAAGNFIGGGSGSGLLIIAAAMALAGVSNTRLLVIAILLIVTGLGLVWLEIGRPWRFLNVYRNPHTSWMSRESYLATALLPLALSAIWFESNVLILLTGLIAGLFLYSQARMLKAARSIAAWRVQQIVPLVITTGIIEGTGILLVAWVFIADLRASIELFDIAIFCWFVIVWRMWTWLAYVDSLSRNVPTHTRTIIHRAQTPFIIVGHFLPAILVIAALLLNRYANVFVLLTGLCVTLSGWGIKFIIITQAALNQGYALPHSPARGAGKPGPGVKPGWTSN